MQVPRALDFGRESRFPCRMGHVLEEAVAEDHGGLDAAEDRRHGGGGYAKDGAESRFGRDVAPRGEDSGAGLFQLSFEFERTGACAAGARKQEKVSGTLTTHPSGNVAAEAAETRVHVCCFRIKCRGRPGGKYSLSGRVSSIRTLLKRGEGRPYCDFFLWPQFNDLFSHAPISILQALETRQDSTEPVDCKWCRRLNNISLSHFC